MSWFRLKACVGRVLAIMGGTKCQWRIIHQQGEPLELAREVMSDVDMLVGRGEMLKAGDRCTVVRLYGVGEGDWTARRYNLKGPGHTAVHWLLHSRAEWCWRNAMLLERASLATPEPLICAEERWLSVLRMRSLFITRYVKGRSLWEMVAAEELVGERLTEVALQFGRIWKTLGRLGIGHGDMKATNFIVDPENRLWMIDLDSMRLHRNRLVLARRRRQDLERFMRNWKSHPAVADIFNEHLGIT